jgi:hypothetical protein
MLEMLTKTLMKQNMIKIRSPVRATGQENDCHLKYKQYCQEIARKNFTLSEITFKN